jgi:hypothetical protein
MIFTCPVCFFDELPYPPEGYHICPSCGTEFGNDDVEFSYAELRQKWADGGAHWFFGQPPANWNPWAQLASHAYGVNTESLSVPNTMQIGYEEYLVA